MKPIIEEITEVGCFQVGEGPHWDVETQSLYFVDIPGKTVHKYVPSTKKHTKITFDKPPSFIIPVHGSTDRFVTSLQKDICVFTWDGVSTKPSHVEVIATLDAQDLNNTSNDAKVDAFGNLWIGTLNSNFDFEKGTPITGVLYSISKKQVKKHVSDISVSNGLAWSKDSKKFYFIDSFKRTVDQYDYDFKNCTIANCRPLFSFDKHGLPGFPDGQTTDENGNLWVAGFQTQKVLNIDTKHPETLLGFIEMPEYLITSVCFGGPNLDHLYVTTGDLKQFVTDPTKLVKGALYRVSGLGVKGLPAERFKL